MKVKRVSAAVIRRGDEILATLRSHGEYRGYWEFPGGKIEEGETPQEALKREIMEELDTEITVGKLIDTIEYDYPTFHLSMDCFWCEVVKGELVLKEAEDMGYEFNVGPECEFFLFHTDDYGNPTTISHEKGSYFDLGPTDLGENARRDMVLNLEEMGFEVEASHHEVAPAQHEIDFKYGEALETADKIMTYKLTVKTIAKRHGLYASFMPKPKYGMCGSGMHINMSLFNKEGQNIFVDENDKNGLSKEAYNFIAGLMKHMRSMTAIINPIVNSYKRLVPGYEAPTYIAWSATNRSPLIRVPAARGLGTRVELRSPDCATNPYLAIAVCLAAGLDGIKNNLQPVDSIQRDIYSMTDEERDEAGIENLPKNLYEAIQEMRKSDFVKGVLGKEVFKKYIKAKEEEWMEYTSQVTDWEIDRYLGRI